MQVNPSEIRSYVNHTIKRYNIRYPLDIHSFVASLGFQIKYVDTGNCDAYTIIAKGKKLILLNQQICAQTRINFTLAHELGHYFIPTHLEPLYACNVNELISSRSLDNPKEEREADIFASELLLPGKLIEKTSNISSFTDITSVAQTYNTSIPATAIKMMAYSYDIVAFICCKKNKIEWVTRSIGLKEYLTLNDLVGLQLPKLSLLNTCKEKKITTYKGKIPAYVWLENVDSSSFIEEEIIFYPKYNTGYILIKADRLVSIDD